METSQSQNGGLPRQQQAGSERRTEAKLWPAQSFPLLFSFSLNEFQDWGFPVHHTANTTPNTHISPFECLRRRVTVLSRRDAVKSGQIQILLVRPSCCSPTCQLSRVFRMIKWVYKERRTYFSINRAGKTYNVFFKCEGGNNNDYEFSKRKIFLLILYSDEFETCLYVLCRSDTHRGAMNWP